MNPESIFAVANTVALVAWIVLILFQRRTWASGGVVIAAVSFFAATYAILIALRWSSSTGSFSTLAGVASLFSDPWLLLAGWLHYLAFDLLVGRWEARDASARGLRPWAVAPSLVLTFLFGPLGWLSYIVLRFALTRTAVENMPAPAAN
jgi:ABA4-like protein